VPSCTYIGVDPGASGGLAALYATGVVRELVPMPATEADVWRWFWRWCRQAWLRLRMEGPAQDMTPVGPWGQAPSEYRIRACIEHVHAFPKQGVSSTFKFGVNYGWLRMALTAADIPTEPVAPMVWMRALGITRRKPVEAIGQWKDRLKAKAQQLFPGRVDITRKTADALLIAEYCRRKHKGTL